MTDSTCAVEACDSKRHCAGYCKMHYTRWRRHGDPAVRLRKESVPAGRPPCSVAGCEKESHARSLCPMHYQRMRQFGSLESPMPTIHERFMAKVRKDESCWIWQASMDGKGYGQIRVTRDGVERLVQAHRLSYELFVGPIPDGKHVDHICHVIKCVNPAHLRTATVKENMEHRSGAAKHSQTGVRGVSLKSPGKYRATIGHNGRHFTVGTFATIAEASSAVIEARNEVFTHNDLDR